MEKKIELTAEELQKQLDAVNAELTSTKDELKKAKNTINEYDVAYRELVNRVNNLHSLYTSVVEHTINNTIVKVNN